MLQLNSKHTRRHVTPSLLALAIRVTVKLISRKVQTSIPQWQADDALKCKVDCCGTVARLCGTLIIDPQQKPAEGGKKSSGHYANTTPVAKGKNGATYVAHVDRYRQPIS